MDKHAIWKWLVLVALVSSSIALIYPPSKKIPLGLDLKGGVSYTLAIDEAKVREDVKAKEDNLTEEEVTKKVNEVLNGSQARAVEVIRNRVDNLGIAEPTIYPGKDNRIIVQLPGVDEAKRKQAEDSINRLAFLSFRMVHEKNDDLVAKLFEKNLAPEGYTIVQMGKESLYKRNRDAVPDDKIDDRFMSMLRRFQAPDKAYDFMLEKVEKSGHVLYKPFFVKRINEVTGDNLSGASVDFRTMGQPVVDITFDGKGSKKFEKITRDYAPGGAKNPSLEKPRYLAIVLDDSLYSAPYIREAIVGGRAEISGSFTLSEANLLANILKAGSLPAPVKVMEKRFVAPSLGKDSIESGVKACVYGALAVVGFMGLYYLTSGVIANVALLLNLMLLPLGMVLAAGFMGLFSGGGNPTASALNLPVLTLPGIAGIVLSLGMAVDANVLIFERIREELAAGKRIVPAIQAGYDRAFVTILDANLTTVIAGIIMFVTGSGPIKGYAVTLCAGILISMYTAIIVTRMIYTVLVEKFKLENLKMLEIVKNPNIDFLGKRNLAVSLSLIIIVCSLGWMVVKEVKVPGTIFSIDFTGGSAVTYSFKDKLPEATIRGALESAGINDSSLQYLKDFDQNKEYLLVKTGKTDINNSKSVDVLKNVFASKLATSGYEMMNEEEVGAMVGSEMKTRALWAVGLSLLGMIIYISWRFEFAFAMGAIVALVHDVLVTVGLFSAMDRPISMALVAILLTIIGFSVNDTIVLFDRIRENLKLMRGKSFVEIANISVNQTLSRTILTSFTVLITVVMLLIFGGGAINDFAVALFIGLIAGTYSTVFIATPVVLWWHKKDHKAEVLGVKQKA